MTILEPTSELWGVTNIVCEDPDVETIGSAVYLPLDQSATWGIVDIGGNLIRGAVDYRESTVPIYKQDISVPLKINSTVQADPSYNYVYGGVINPHYGHFLVDTLPRFWAMRRLLGPATKIVCHAPDGASKWWRCDFIASIFSALDLTPKDFVTFNEPTRIDGLVIPHTSFKEQFTAHHAYARLCRGIGDKILQGYAKGPNAAYVYFSKSKLQSAVGLIENESEMEEIIRNFGIRIVYPEQISFVEQLRIFSDYECILGTIGSFLHSSIFVGRRRIVSLSVTAHPNSNYVLIDKLSGNDSTYLYPPAIELRASRPGVMTQRYLPNSADVTREMLRVAGVSGVH